MSEALLTVNAGASSIKFAIFRCETRIQARPELTGQIHDTGDAQRSRLIVMDPDGHIMEDSILQLDGRPRHAGLNHLVEWLRNRKFDGRLVGIGHRIVHGGWRYSRPMILDDVAVGELRDAILLAPLHQSHSLDAVEALRQAFPAVCQVACFDTDFHTQNDLAPRSEFPSRVLSELQCQGFHGLSYEYVADVLPAYLGARADGRVIVAHLGDSASLCAMHGRRSLAATMSFMAENSAEDHFCYRILREIGSLVATIGGLDALVFTGGAGERMAPVRSRVCLALHWLGVDLDAAANANDAIRIAHDGSKVDVLVLPANEAWIVARHTAKRLWKAAPDRTETTPAA